MTEIAYTMDHLYPEITLCLVMLVFNEGDPVLFSI